jgi:hypothetical protein
MEDLKMQEKFDYSFFEDSLHRERKLRAYSIDKSPLLKAPRLLFSDMDLGDIPKVLEGTSDDPSQVILARSIARKRDQKLDHLKYKIWNPLPDDFREFHEIYDEALIVTRTMPIHLWTEDDIIKNIDIWRDCFDHPIRFFRFGGYWDYDLHFGLWKPDENSEWSVVITSNDNRDDIFETYDLGKEQLLSSSFYKWIHDLIKNDGIPDPYMGIGVEGGFLDPA